MDPFGSPYGYVVKIAHLNFTVPYVYLPHTPAVLASSAFGFTPLRCFLGRSTVSPSLGWTRIVPSAVPLPPTPVIVRPRGLRLQSSKQSAG